MASSPIPQQQRLLVAMIMIMIMIMNNTVMKGCDGTDRRERQKANNKSKNCMYMLTIAATNHHGHHGVRDDDDRESIFVVFPLLPMN
mmetsp:Transcript_52229/g.126197  ORF Transcript_52229/g.126197 Transcript_52229/m.126197 type:complete len:87 (+) Transcript_52229:3050-3310(+)